MESEVLELVTTLAYLADLHHRTIDSSKLHNPGKNINFWECKCLSCMRATKVIAKYSNLSYGALLGI